MKATKRKILALSAALALCIAAIAALRLPERREPGAAEETAYLFSNYPGPESLLGVSLENASGGIVMACVDGVYYVSSEEGLDADAAAVEALFSAACRLPLAGLLEGADAADPQYGLTEPRASVAVQDVQQDGFLFSIGSPTPDGTACYACLNGDSRVFLMENAYADMFLADVQEYYDLSLFPSLEGDGLGRLATVAVERDGAAVYQIRQVDNSPASGLAYFALETPFRLLLSSDRCSSEILTPLQTLSGTRYISQPNLAACGLTDSAPRVVLTDVDGTRTVLRIGGETGSSTYVLSENTGMVVLVPTASLGFVYDSVLDLVGKKLLTLNLRSVSSVVLNGHTYRLTAGDSEPAVTRDGEAMPLEDFRNGVFAALNSIFIQGMYSGGEPLEDLLLTADIQTAVGNEAIRLEFYKMGGRQCAVAVNGEFAFWCNAVVADNLLSAL